MSLMLLFLVMSMFYGFMSRCATPRECRYSTALTSCWKMILACSSSSLFLNIAEWLLFIVDYQVKELSSFHMFHHQVYLRAILQDLQELDYIRVS